MYLLYFEDLLKHKPGNYFKIWKQTETVLSLLFAANLLCWGGGGGGKHPRFLMKNRYALLLVGLFFLRPSKPLMVIE